MLVFHLTNSLYYKHIMIVIWQSSWVMPVLLLLSRSVDDTSRITRIIRRWWNNLECHSDDSSVIIYYCNVYNTGHRALSVYTYYNIYGPCLYLGQAMPSRRLIVAFVKCWSKIKMLKNASTWTNKSTTRWRIWCQGFSSTCHFFKQQKSYLSENVGDSRVGESLLKGKDQYGWTPCTN